MRGFLAIGLIGLAAACGPTSASPPPIDSASAPSAAAAPGAPAVDGCEPAAVSTWPPRTATGAAPEELELAMAADAYVDPLDAVSRDRAVVASFDLHERVLTVSDEVFRAHWGRDRGPLDVHTAKLPERRRALLFPDDHDPSSARPLLVVADAQHRVLWQKANPFAGAAGWRHPTVAAGPEGSVLVFWWDESRGAVVARRWRHGGRHVGDHRVLDAASCTGLDVVWWPGHGWVVTVMADGTARTTLLGEDGRRRFGDAVVDLGGPREVHRHVRVGAGVEGVFHAFAARARAAPGAPLAPWRLVVTFRREDGSAPWGRELVLGPLEVAAPPPGRPPLDLLDALNAADPDPQPSRPGMRFVGIRLALHTPDVARIEGLATHLVRSDGTLDPEVRGWAR